jgi:FMN phosphatase YigB (HAD superfamily)
MMGCFDVQVRRERIGLCMGVAFMDGSTPQAIFFDAGDTLIHGAMEESFAEFCGQHGFSVALDRVRDAYRRFIYEGGPYFSCHRHLYETDPRLYWHGANRAMLEFLGLSGQDAERLARCVFAEFRVRWRVFPDVFPTLEALTAVPFTLGVISNWGLDLEETLEQVSRWKLGATELESIRELGSRRKLGTRAKEEA